MKIYRVGGSVRDQLLGLPVKDHDYVVVGATPESMEAQGFKPVGKDFPVFLHPQTHEEYALARTERKSGRGYKGFTVQAAPEVTLEEDLARRDLTINAMARDDAGALIDPFHGERDLRDGILRHVSPAFVEDPVRILRVARFAARFGFRVAEDTMALMRHMVDSGEADHLVPERVWQEFSLGLMETKPSLMLTVMDECGALKRVLPELHDCVRPRTSQGARLLTILERSTHANATLPVRFALLTYRNADNLPALSDRIRASGECKELAQLAANHLDTARDAKLLKASELVALLRNVDAFRRPERFADFLKVMAIDDAADPVFHGPSNLLLAALDAAESVNAGEIAAATSEQHAIPEAINAARNAAVELFLQKHGQPH